MTHQSRYKLSWMKDGNPEMSYDIKAYRLQQAAEDLRISQIQDIAASLPHN